jgi:hypothetical protein
MAFKPTRGAWLAMFVVSLVFSAVLITLLRWAQGLGPLTDLGTLLLVSIALTPAAFFVLSRPTNKARLIAFVVVLWSIAIFMRAVWDLQTYSFGTGIGLLTFLDGPIFTVPLVIVLAIILVPKLQIATLMGIGGAIVAAIGIVVIRSLQHLDPAFDLGTVLLFAVLAGLGGFATGAGFFDPRSLFAGEPSLPRATWMAIMGFLFGGLIVVVVRGLQSIAPLWDPGVGLTVTAFMTAGFFVWGIGAFDPKMSVHGEHAEEEAPAETSTETPGTILGTYIWRAAFLTLAVLLVVIFFALVPGGPFIRTTLDAGGNVGAAGDIPIQMPFGTVQVSKLVFFIGFFLFTLLSLAVIGGGLSLMFYLGSRAVIELRNTEPTPEELTPPEPVQALSGFAGSVAKALRSGLPKVLGQR